MNFECHLFINHRVPANIIALSFMNNNYFNYRLFLNIVLCWIDVHGVQYPSTFGKNAVKNIEMARDQL